MLKIKHVIMVKFKVIDRVDRLMSEYVEIIESVYQLHTENREEAMQKLKETAKLERQIEELKQARLN
ncbi:hypothetical protein N9N72_00575 [bacterium]|nr:hypothetical protein [bacterium]